VQQRFLLLILWLSCLPAWALNGGIIEAGHGNGIDQVRIGVISNMDERLLTVHGWHVAGHWEAGLGSLRGRGATARSAAEISLTPVLRFRPDAQASTQPYLEGGIGVHLVSQDRLDDQHDFGSNLLLGELIGMGVTFGGRSQYDIGYRLHHLGSVNNTGKNAATHSVRLIYAY